MSELSGGMSGYILHELYRNGDRRDDRRRRHSGGFEPIGASANRLAMKFGVMNDGDWMAQLDLAIKRTDFFVTNETKKEIEKAIDICESPIEKHLLPWLLVQRHWLFDYPTIILRNDRLKMQLHCGCIANGHAIGLIPQCRIGQFRVDFAYVWYYGGDLLKVVIECDGEEYHKDKEKDLAREKNLLKISHVLDILRFTGSEIYANPEKCAYLAAASAHGACNATRMKDT